MIPIILAKKILDLEEKQLFEVLLKLQMENIDLYNELKEKIEDII